MLEAGRRIGPYEIEGLLGAGGMGQVYRARDPRLQRDVALKVLHEHLAADTGRLKRFQQEALAASALNHPGILSVYDAGQHEGAPYLVFELLEGRTLREALTVGIPQRSAVEYAAQAARALAAAHDRGIVHRDIKPENLFLTREGRLKVLDFGVAKLRQPTSERTETTTLETGVGEIVGTLGYMSPEQLQGADADARADVFALGAVLYEMLSGRRAFAGKTAAETVSAILHDDPPELEGSRPVAPPLEAITRRCLEKQPEERFQSARDLAFALEALTGASGSGAASGRAVRKRAWVRPAVATAALLAAFTLGVLARPGPAPPPSYQQLSFRRGVVRSARFAPGGSAAIYTARWGDEPIETFSTDIGRPESRPLGLADTLLLAISSRGELALVLRPLTNSPVLARAPLNGGAPRELATDVISADWSPDGNSLAVARSGATFQLEYPLGKVLYSSADRLDGIRVSPAGDRVAFREARMRLRVAERDGTVRTLSEGWSEIGEGAWSPRGDEFWFSAADAGNSFAIYGVDLRGRRRLVARGAGTLRLLDVSKEGRALVAQSFVRSVLVARAPDALEERELGWFDRSELADLSQDGRTLLFNEPGKAGGAEGSVYVRQTDGSPAVRLAEGAGMELSPDGHWVTTLQDGRIVLVPTGVGEPRVLSTPGLTLQGGGAWFPDGKRIHFTASQMGRPARTFALAVPGGEPEPLTPEGTEGFPVSPDGRAIVCRNAAGAFLIQPLDGSPPRAVPGLSPEDIGLRWGQDSRTLYVATSFREAPVSVYRVDVTTGRKSLWKQFRPADPAGFFHFTWISLTPDERAWAYGYRRSLDDLYLVDGMR